MRGKVQAPQCEGKAHLQEQDVLWGTSLESAHPFGERGRAAAYSLPFSLLFLKPGQKESSETEPAAA